MTYPKSWDSIQPPQIGSPEYYEMLRHEWNDFGPFFQYYSGNIRDSIPKGIIELDVFIEKIRHPKDTTKQLMFDIRTETMFPDIDGFGLANRSDIPTSDSYRW